MPSLSLRRSPTIPMWHQHLLELAVAQTKAYHLRQLALFRIHTSLLMGSREAAVCPTAIGFRFHVEMSSLTSLPGFDVVDDAEEISGSVVPLWM